MLGENRKKETLMRQNRLRKKYSTVAYKFGRRNDKDRPDKRKSDKEIKGLTVDIRGCRLFSDRRCHWHTESQEKITNRPNVHSKSSKIMQEMYWEISVYSASYLGSQRGFSMSEKYLRKNI